MSFGCRFILLICVLGCCLKTVAQRSYATNSVLATGEWYKVSVKAAGIYKIDIPFLNSLGVNTSNLSSGAIRIFGNGGDMLAEANSGPWMDDIKENAIQVVDGGDGILNGSDYILFYATGPDKWVNDAANQQFTHIKNLYTDKAFYFINIGSNGKRVSNAPVQTGASISINSFSERYFHELDTINFLGSGKEWYGEEMSSLPGRSLNRSFNINSPNVVAGTSLQLKTNCVARSVGTGSRFDVRINNQLVGQLPIAAVGGGAYDLFVQQATATLNGIASQNGVDVTFSYVPGGFNAQGWLNWFELFIRRPLSLTGTEQLLFRDWQSVGNSAAEFVITGANSSTQVWDVTNPLEPLRLQSNFLNNEVRFINSASSLKEYIAFNPTGFLTPVNEGKVVNQNLHDSRPADFIIVTIPTFLAQAQRLAKLHQQRDGLRTLIVTVDQINNEFASGGPDPVAIRDFVKMYHDKHRNNPVDQLKYLLLFGDASFDYKNRINGNTNFVPGYQNNFSSDPLSTYTSDDFFGFLDDQEDVNNGAVLNLLDIGIGRVPAKNIAEAKNYVDKVIAYTDAKSLGPWRNTLTFIADDEDNNLHLQDAELFTTTATSTAPVFNTQKIYLDAYQQQSGAAGNTYPLANQAINSQVFNGTLIYNYNGHGGFNRLAEETILDQQVVNSWVNEDKLPLFITATCDFAPYDNPSINSLGENILLRPKTGAIALMTTTRLVFAFSNKIINNNYLQFALQPDASGKYKTLGDAVKEAKNYTYQTFADIANNRKFTLLGDPALTLGFPPLKAKPVSINGIPVATLDTLTAGEKITIEGEITDNAGNIINGFNGNVYPSIFDKPQTVTTLANDPGSSIASFQSQNTLLFKGKSSVTNGRFSFSFKVPRDINYQFGNGKLSLYAEDGNKDANGFFSNFVIGGGTTTASQDRQGPEIKLFLNDDQFVNGGITNQNPVLLIKLKDSSGINTAGIGIGHDLVATLDNDPRRFFILNDFYQAALNSYQQGEVRFQLPVLDPGPHTIKVKAWDTENNSNEGVIDFVVANDEELELSHVLNYPNPFSTHTNFWFEHNKPGLPLQVHLQIMTITGRTIKTFSRTIITDGNRSAELEWDGRDDYGDKVARGVYLYKLRVISPDKKKKEVIERLVIL
jgi:hypothetical protein